MNKRIKLLIIALAAGILMPVLAQPPATLEKPAQQQSTVIYTPANALDIVAEPEHFLNKNVTVKGKFDKFSTLGLDYQPAYKSSEDYITFLIQRDDVKDHNIPLSEMKIFLKRAEAEKHIDLNAGDEIEFSGKVFSTALGDVWVEAEKFTVLTQKPKNK